MINFISIILYLQMMCPAPEPLTHRQQQPQPLTDTAYLPPNEAYFAHPNSQHNIFHSPIT